MKLKSIILVCCLSICTFGFAANVHLHSPADHMENKPAKNALKWPGYCEIEIVNNSYDDVRVFGVFDDGSSLQPFNVYSYESPHYISLYYYGYCHSGMDIYIDTFRGMRIYGGYTQTNSTIRIEPFFGNQLKANVSAR